MKRVSGKMRQGKGVVIEVGVRHASHTDVCLRGSVYPQAFELPKDRAEWGVGGDSNTDLPTKRQHTRGSGVVQVSVCVLNKQVN